MTPPKDGAFVCTFVEAEIYCSVMCSPTSEFTSFPDNPYRCGSSTKFHWENFFGECINQLPQCHGKFMLLMLAVIIIIIIIILFNSLAGFRYSSRSIFDDDNYLPSSCSNLSVPEIDQVKRNFCNQLDLWYFLMCNSMEDVYIQCVTDQ